MKKQLLLSVALLALSTDMFASYAARMAARQGSAAPVAKQAVAKQTGGGQPAATYAGVNTMAGLRAAFAASTTQQQDAADMAAAAIEAAQPVAGTSGKASNPAGQAAMAVINSGN